MGYTCECLNCGYVNEDLDLEETDGSMECEKCGTLFHFVRPYQSIRFSASERMAFFDWMKTDEPVLHFRRSCDNAVALPEMAEDTTGYFS